MGTNAFRSQQSKRRSRRAFRPGVLGLEERMLMTVIPSYPQNDGLDVKRVPGFLAGSTVKGAPPDLAVPDDLANASGRMINDATVDYWAITLNKDDSMLLNVAPEDGQPASGLAIRIAGPNDNTVIGKATPGPTLAFVAPANGTYIIGISTSANTNYSFNPKGEQKSASGPSLRDYTAEFQTFPGPKTNLLDILQNYHNPAYGASDWPALSVGQRTAYDNLTTIARAGAK